MLLCDQAHAPTRDGENAVHVNDDWKYIRIVDKHGSFIAGFDIRLRNGYMFWPHSEISIAEDTTPVIKLLNYGNRAD